MCRRVQKARKINKACYKVCVDDPNCRQFHVASNSECTTFNEPLGYTKIHENKKCKVKGGFGSASTLSECYNSCKKSDYCSTFEFNVADGGATDCYVVNCDSANGGKLFANTNPFEKSNVYSVENTRFDLISEDKTCKIKNEYVTKNLEPMTVDKCAKFCEDDPSCTDFTYGLDQDALDRV